MRVFFRILTVVVCLCTGNSSSTAADFSSMEDFVKALDGVSYECSFRTNPRLEFFADRIDVLDSKGKSTRTVKGFSYTEPGLVQIKYKSGASTWIAFSDDLASFAIANMETRYECSGSEAGDSFSGAGTPMTLTLTGHSSIAKVEVAGETITLFSEDGSKLSERKGFRYLPHAIGFVDEEQKVGFLLLSREKPGGWWMEGKYLGAGVRTDKGGLFKLDNRSPLKGFLQRSVQFPKVLLRAGLPSVAAAQEHYAVSKLEEAFEDDSSAAKIHGYKEIGMARANLLNRVEALPWYEKAFGLASEHLTSDSEEYLEYITLYGDGLADTGDFEKALAILGQGVALVEKVDEGRPRYRFFEAFGKAEFGARNYEAAIKQFQAKVKVGEEVDLWGVVAQAYMEMATCYRAAGNAQAAVATLDKAIAAQEKRQAARPNSVYDTYRLAFACAAFERWEDALRYAPKSTRKSSVTYQEYARLAALWNRGERKEATELAKQFVSRFRDDLDEVLIRRDMDTMVVRLTEAVANPSAETSAAFSAEWNSQKESLRNRPLENYFFALVLLKAKQAMP